MNLLGLGFLMVFGKHEDWRGPCLVFGHLSQYEVPHLHKNWALSPKKIAAALFTSQGVGNMEHLLEDQADIQCMYVGLEILARVPDFFFGHPHLISCNRWDCAIRGRWHCTKWHTFVQEQPWEETPACHHSQRAILMSSVGFFELQTVCDF